ncbi:unnamed protein product [Trichogramma brassicae]|uniref:Uncharacterized protein n=1 Tax=Trichogramma brassicae TaxID=86971 RepID=A0A6H5IKY3_9HYME|nr:unnamed protein product [Trichogramma brassicae]
MRPAMPKRSTRLKNSEVPRLMDTSEFLLQREKSNHLFVAIVIQYLPLRQMRRVAERGCDARRRRGEKGSWQRNDSCEQCWHHALSSIPRPHAGGDQKDVRHQCDGALLGMMEALSEELRVATSCGGTNSNIQFTIIYPYMVDTGLCKKPKIKFPSLMSVVSPKEAAAQIVRAQRRNTPELSIPSHWLSVNYFLRNRRQLILAESLPCIYSYTSKLPKSEISEMAAKKKNVVVEWLNEASISNDETVKVENLSKVQEIIINQEPLLLDNYLEEVLQFALDRNAKVRQSIAGLIEEAALEK